MTISKLVGARVKELRNQKGLSQEKLAELAGLDRTYITYVETGKKNVTIDTLYKITLSLEIPLNEFFNFDEFKCVMKSKDKLIMNLSDLTTGNIYTNQQVAAIFLTSTQGGIRPSNRRKTVTLISTDTSDTNPYKDSTVRSDGSFVYTGMGKTGNQVVTKTNQNGKIAYSDTNGYTLYYFVMVGKNQYQFKGQCKLNGEYYFIDEPDILGKLRKVVKFPLKLV